MKHLLLATAIMATFGNAQAQCNGVVLKITNGKVEKYDINGNYKGIIATSATEADCNNDVAIVLMANGKVEKYDLFGNYKGVITTDATRARISGDLIIGTKTNGRVEKYDFSGNYKGVI